MSKNCQRCESERIIQVYTHGKDMNNICAEYLNYEKDGYLPEIPNISVGGDDTEYDVCLECGQIQGTWPVSDSCLLGFDDSNDLHGFTKKEIIKLMAHYDCEDIGDMFEYLQDEYGGNTIDETLSLRDLANKEANERAKEALRRDEERARLVAETLERTRGTNQYYKLNVSKHFAKEALSDPNIISITQAIKPSVKKWFVDNKLPFLYEENMGEWGSLVFAVIEDKMAFMNSESKGRFIHD